VNLDDFLLEWSALHGGAAAKGVVRGWLRISYALTRPLIWLRVSPDAVTYLGLILGVSTWWEASHLISMALLIFSLIADGIDGSLAITSQRVSRWGAELDSVVDRVVEFFWALTFIKIGGPAIIVGLAWAAALVQEYARARAAGLGYRSIGVVTISERPVRAIFLALALAIHFLEFHFLTLIASIWCVLQVLSLMMVLRDSYSALRSDN
jgi:archaetidylinositol phosphate synthase